MIAVDTNILVYAHREDSPFYAAANKYLRDIAQRKKSWAIAWPSIHEFYAVVTNPRIYNPPSTLTQAINQIESWLESPTLTILGESELHWETLKPLLQSGKVRGAQVHDAKIAAICLQHQVDQLWSADRDFSRYPQLLVVNPLIET